MDTGVQRFENSREDRIPRPLQEEVVDLVSGCEPLLQVIQVDRLRIAQLDQLRHLGVGRALHEQLSGGRLERRTDLVDVLDVLPVKRRDTQATCRGGLDESLALELPQRLAHGGPAHAGQLDELALREPPPGL